MAEEGERPEAVPPGNPLKGCYGGDVGLYRVEGLIERRFLWTYRVIRTLKSGPSWMFGVILGYIGFTLPETNMETQKEPYKVYSPSILVWGSVGLWV